MQQRVPQLLGGTSLYATRGPLRTSGCHHQSGYQAHSVNLRVAKLSIQGGQMWRHRSKITCSSFEMRACLGCRAWSNPQLPPVLGACSQRSPLLGRRCPPELTSHRGACPDGRTSHLANTPCSDATGGPVSSRISAAPEISAAPHGTKIPDISIFRNARCSFRAAWNGHSGGHARGTGEVREGRRHSPADDRADRGRCGWYGGG